jgi:hypothetical protein
MVAATPVTASGGNDQPRTGPTWLPRTRPAATAGPDDGTTEPQPSTAATCAGTRAARALSTGQPRPRQATKDGRTALGIPSRGRALLDAPSRVGPSRTADSGGIRLALEPAVLGLDAPCSRSGRRRERRSCLHPSGSWRTCQPAASASTKARWNTTGCTGRWVPSRPGSRSSWSVRPSTTASSRNGRPHGHALVARRTRSVNS